jgi:uncharacterized membrane protein YphA (DoxX/SURF4 family)
VGAYERTPKRRKGHLQRLFSAFPAGWPGVGLLLLRVAVGLVALIQGGFYLGAKAESISGGWVGAALGLAAGVALVVGLLTPLAALLTVLGAIGTGLSLWPAPAPNLFDSVLSVVLISIVTTAILFLGPGAFSLDGRLFGRREIIIPRRPEQ